MADSHDGAIWAEDAEKALVGGFLLDWEAQKNRVARARCKPHMLYGPANRSVYEACELVEKAGMVPDAVSVCVALEQTGKLAEIGGRDYVAHLMETSVGANNAPAYARIVQEHYARRLVVQRCRKLAGSAQAGADIRSVYEQALGLPRGLAPETTEVYRLADISIEDTADQEFIKTGYSVIDEATGGYPRSEMSVVMAHTGRGKSSWLLWAAHNVAQSGGSVVFATYEMPAKAIKRRLLKHLTGWTHRPTLSLQAAAKFDEALQQIEDRWYDLEIYDPSSRMDSRFTVEELRDYLLAKSEVQSIDMVVVDYYQRLGTERRFGQTFEELAYVSRSLAALAKRLGCALIAGSQVSEEPSGQGMRVRGSREGENDAALILQIAPGQNEIKVAKARHGAHGATMPVMFDRDRLVFVEV